MPPRATPARRSRKPKTAQRSDERFGLLIQAVKNYAIFMLDAHGEIVSWSGGAERVIGYRAEEIIGRPLSSLYTSEDRARGKVERHLESASAAGRLDEEGWRVRKDGTRFRADVVLTAIRDDTGRLRGFVEVTRDVTLRHEARHVMARTAPTAHASEHDASELVAMMTHEIRAPLNSIIGFTELALGTPLDEEQRRYLTTTRAAGETLLALIEELLVFARIGTGTMTLQETSFDLRRHLSETLHMLAPLAFTKRLELVCAVEPDVPREVVGDGLRLRQVLVNLVGNAVKFTPEGEVVVRVAVADRTGDGSVVLHFRVSDTGRGIALEERARIFEPFVQADGSPARPTGGAGLGLAISRRLVELMGGRIWVESEIGAGSTFQFTTPMHVRHSGGLTPLAALHGQRVLVADDNALVRAVLTATLQSWGAEVVVAADGASARRAALAARWERPFDLCVADADLRDGDGTPLAAALAQAPETRALPIAWLVAPGAVPPAAPGSERVVQLAKPCVDVDLLDALRTLLAPRPATNGHRAAAETHAPGF